jgi:hypothetical protein
VSTASSSSASTARAVISEKARPQSLATAAFPASGRKMKATQATQSRRMDIPLILAGRPTARCGSAPTIMPMAVTVTTCSAVC